VRERKFSFNGKSLTIKANPIPDGWTVQVVDDQMKVVLKINFTVSFETEVDFRSIHGDLAEYLMDFAENEVKISTFKL
jgi:hypothetical protein